MALYFQCLDVLLKNFWSDKLVVIIGVEVFGCYIYNSMLRIYLDCLPMLKIVPILDSVIKSRVLRLIFNDKMRGPLYRGGVGQFFCILDT